MTGDATRWREYVGRWVVLHALEASYAARHAAGYLREAEDAAAMLERMLSPGPDGQSSTAQVYLVEPFPQAESIAHDMPAGITVHSVGPEEPRPDLSRLIIGPLVTGWLGADATRATVILQGLAGVVAGATSAGPTVADMDANVRADLAAHRPVSVRAAPVDTSAATSFVAYLVHTFGQGTLRQLLADFQPQRPDHAFMTVYHQPLAALEEAWLGSLRHRTDTSSGTLRRFFARVGVLLKPYWVRELEVLAYIAFGISYNVVLPLSGKYFVDSILPTDDVPTLLVFAILLLAFMLAHALVGMRRTRVSAELGQRMVNDLDLQVFSHLQQLSHEFYARSKVGDLISRLSNDMQLMHDAITQVTGVGLFLSLNVLTACIVLFALSPLLGIVMLLLIPALSATYRVLADRFSRASAERQALAGAAIAAAQENLSAHNVVKALGLETRAIDAYRARLMSVLRASVRLTVIGSLFETSVLTAISVGQVIVLGVGGYLVIQGQLTIGTLLAVWSLLPALLFPVAALANVVQSVQNASGALDRIAEVLEERVEISDAPDALDLPPLTREIRLERVNFSYGGPQLALRDLDLVIPAGRHLAIVGPSGSGKSTLVSLLMRFADPRQGRICFDGHDLRELRRASLRAQIGLVFQDTFIFDTTVRENIQIGRPDASEADIAAAAQAAQLDTYIDSLPDGYDTVLGERGVRMSGGQRQRMAIARALLRDPRVLILDEATSALDVQTERELLETLGRVAQARTRITITHRLALAATADHIVVLQHGRIVEQGTHAAMLHRGGPYQQLHDEQAAYAAGLSQPAIDIDATWLQAIPLLRGIDARTLGAVANALTSERHAAGEDIIRHGEIGDTLYIIRRGEVDVLVHDRDRGVEHRVNTLTEGDYFGEIALMQDEPRTATLRTTVSTELYRLHRTTLATLIESAPSVRDSLLHTMDARRAALHDIARRVAT